MLPLSSVAMQITVVTPGLNTEPEGGSHTTSTSSSQISLAVTSYSKVTGLSLPSRQTSSGQLMSGGVVS